MAAEREPAAPGDEPTESRSLYTLRPFGNYVLVQKLAEGGMAEIYLAKQVGVEGFERNVVIKQMLGHLSRQPEFVDMFLDEARLAARLTHPNIIQIYDLGHVEDSYYICMEYLPGEDLAWILRQARSREKAIPIDIAVRIVIDAAHGLHHAHELADADGKPLHLVHRDVSPANVLIGYEGEVKLLDFGIAKAESRVTSTDVGTVKGKALYMSPEQSRADPIDRRADIYSLGVTLYELLTRERPFARDTVQAIADATARGDFVPPRRHRSEVSSELERIVQKAMARDPADRYSTAGAFAADLEKVLDTSTPTGPGAIGRWLRDFCGDEQVAQKTRIPSLDALERGAVSSGRLKALVRRPATDASSERTRRATKKKPAERRNGRWFVAGFVLAVAAAIAVGWRLRMAPTRPEGCDFRFGPDAKDAIVVGASLPLSVNKTPEDGQLQLLNAMRLALDEINQRDGVAGRMFALQACDNAGELARSKEQTRWLVENVGVPVVVTSWSSHTLAAVNVTLPKNVLTITADATSPEISAVPASPHGVRLLWRTAPSDAMQGKVLAELIAHDPAFAGLTQIAIVYQDDPYGQGLSGVVSSELARIAPTVKLRTIQYPLRGDVGEQVRQLAAWKPQLTMVFGFPLDAVRIINQATREPVLQKKNGHRWFFSDSAKEPTLINKLEHPEEIDGAYGLEAADGGGDEAASFQRRFLSRFRRDPVDQTYASNRYDAMYLVALGAAWALGADGKGALTGERMAEGLTHLSSGKRFGLVPEQFTAAKAIVQAGGSIDVAGASGGLDFDNATGEAPASFQVWRVKGAGFEKGRRIELAR